MKLWKYIIASNVDFKKIYFIMAKIIIIINIIKVHSWEFLNGICTLSDNSQLLNFKRFKNNSNKYKLIDL